MQDNALKSFSKYSAKISKDKNIYLTYPDNQPIATYYNQNKHKLTMEIWDPEVKIYKVAKIYLDDDLCL
jgi:hypothetical protein